MKRNYYKECPLRSSIHSLPPSLFHLSHRRWWPWDAPAFHNRASPWDLCSSQRCFQPATIVQLLYMSKQNLPPPPHSAAHDWDGLLFCRALWGLYDLVEAQPSLFYLSGLLYRLVDHQASVLVNKSVRSTQGLTRPHFIYTLRPTEQKGLTVREIKKSERWEADKRWQKRKIVWMDWERWKASVRGLQDSVLAEEQALREKKGPYSAGFLQMLTSDVSSSRLEQASKRDGHRKER